MKSMKKVLLTGILTTVAVCTMAVTVKATTVKVTGETINIRKGPSTSTAVVAMLSKGVECEVLGEEGDWYQVKYKNYKGYVSKQYVKLQQTSSDNKTNDNNTQEPKKDDENKDAKDDQNTNSQDNKANEDTKTNENTQPQITYKKLNQNTNAKILPLIHASQIGEIKKEEQVILLTTVGSWSYVQASNMSGWVRTDNLVDAQATTTSSEPETKPQDTNKEKTAYVNEEFVNVRKSAGTNSSIVKVLSLNSQITITGEEGDWYKVKSGKDTGYILKEFVSNTKRVTSRSSEVSRTEQSTEIENWLKEYEEQNKEDKKQSNDTKNQEKNNQTTSQENNQTSNNQNESSNENKEQTTNNTTKGTDVVAYAKQFLGHKYVYGGDGSNGTFDCSGFTMYVYKHFGITLPHGAGLQYRSGKGTKITKQNDLQVGDIVCLTEYGTGKGIGHCGIYIGNGNFIHASTTTYTVTISNLNTMYKGRFYGGLRLI